MSRPTGRSGRFAFISLSILAASLCVPAGSLAAEAAGEEKPVAIPWGPYLQNLTPTGVTVMWTASTPNQGAVEYGLDEKKLDGRRIAKPVEPEDGQRQEATLTGLEPGTIYHYRVTSTPKDGRAAVSSQPGTFATPVPGRTSVTFAIIADTHQSRHAPALAARLHDEQPHFILLAGDYNKTMGGLLVPYREVVRRIPIYFAKGNHDHKHDQWASMPGPGNDLYYAFRWAGALFLSVDTNDRKGLTPAGEQYKWLEGELKASRDTWRFVFQHHPVYSAWGGRMDPRLDDLRQLFEKYKVDVVFQGHMHNYDRSFPLRDQKPVGRADGGVTYITASGACGGYEKFPHPHRLWFIARQWRGAPFVGLCSVNGRHASIQFVTADGLLFDSLELTARQPAGAGEAKE